MFSIRDKNFNLLKTLLHTAIDHYRVDEESRGENKVKDVKDDFIKVNNFVKDGVKGKLGSSFRDSNLVQR